MPVRCEECDLKLPDGVNVDGGLRQVNHCIVCGSEVS